ncbi:MAG: RNA polymerase sigma factor [Gammaproteobacteria bacterium]|nr:RNA polymerase sigma factor [Gammaproteobacteria bacterium]
MGKTATKTQSIESVYRNNAHSLSRFLARFLDSSVEIEDVLQETFLKALEVERVTKIERPLPFLFRIARNLAFNAIGRRRRQRTDLVADFDEISVLIDLRLISELDPESGALVEERLAFAKEIIERLTPRVQEVFVLRKVYGFTHNEIAAQLKIAVSTVEKHIAQGVLQVKRQRDLHEPDAASPVTEQEYLRSGLGGEAQR